MQAIIRHGGKQYLVKENDKIEVSRMANNKDKEVELEVLAIFNDNKVDLGTPTVAKGKVIASILGDKKGEKIDVYKYKSKTKYRRKIGHRDELTVLQIKTISS